MIILQVHNTYQFKGGEDQVLLNEYNLLKKNGEDVYRFEVSNDHITSLPTKIKIALITHYSKKSKQKMAEQLDRIKPDIVHVHNFFPTLTPSIYDACIEKNVPIVQTLHNYRTICPGALLLRNGEICEKCISGSPYHAVIHRCYRNSVLGSLTVANMVAYHRRHHTWENKVDCYITMTPFLKTIFTKAGFPEDKLYIKPHFCSALDNNSTSDIYKQALFVGRLSQEKGIHTLLDVWKDISYKLLVAGDGPLLGTINNQSHSNVNFLGNQTRKEISSLMEISSFLIMPSMWYETFGMVIIEAFSHGLPVICSNIGGMAEIVEDGITGLHFEAGNAVDLAEKVNWMIENPDDCRQMGENAYKVYKEKYTPEKNYQILIDIYQQTIDNYKKQ